MLGQRLVMRMSSTMMKPKVFVTKSIPLKAVTMLQEKCEVSLRDIDTPASREVLKQEIKDVDGLFCQLTDNIDADLLDCATKLKVIGTMSVGYDHIDVKECRKRKLLLGYTPDVLTEATAELTVALLLCTARRFMEAAEQVRNGGWGAWRPLWMCGRSVQGSTVGILGLGRIGLSVARKLLPFQPKRIMYCNRTEKRQEAETVKAEFVTLAELLAQSDFLIVTCALTAQTRYMFNSQVFERMKNDAILINTSRGPIVDMDALYTALSCGQIAAAGLDVTDPEPLPVDHKLLSLQNCVILPHIGSATVATRERMATLTSENILAALFDQPMPAAIPQ